MSQTLFMKKHLMKGDLVEMKSEELKESSKKKKPGAGASINEVKEYISPKSIKNPLAKGYYQNSRFNKEKFNLLMRAMLNDPSFMEESVKYYHKDLQPVELAVTKDFRKFIKKILEKMGIDSNEAKSILDPEFKIDNVDGLYEFFASAIYEYMDLGNKFDLLPKKDFKGTIYLSNEEEKKRVYKARDPFSGKSLGEVEVTTGKHKKLKVSSSAPKWMVKRAKLNQ